MDWTPHDGRAPLAGGVVASPAYVENERIYGLGQAEPVPVSGPQLLGHEQHQASSWGVVLADTWEDWGGSEPLEVTVTKRAESSDLLIRAGYDIQGSGATPTAFSTWQDGFDVGGTVYGPATRLLEGGAGGSRWFHFTRSLVVQTIPAGPVAVTLVIDSTGGDGVETDTSNHGWLEVWEIPIPVPG